MRGPTRVANPARPVRCSANCGTLVWLKGALPTAADAEFVCASCTAARRGAVLPTWRCHGCDWAGSLEGAAIHEHNRHEGAQTCWPIDEELDSYRALKKSGGLHPDRPGEATRSDAVDAPRAAPDDHCPHCWATDVRPLSKGLRCTNDWHWAKAGRS